ncbi:MAG TPA: hypothetical protein DD426_03370 [Clostridiaceae bacterium]|nr:hypothetical protein [Clostridiaceae bacterium]
MKGNIYGKVFKDAYTKRLIHKIDKRGMAVIRHKALDLVAAEELRHKKIKAVINCCDSIDKNGCNEGIGYLLKSGIRIFDALQEDFFDGVKDGDMAEIADNKIYINGTMVSPCREIFEKDIENLYMEDNNYRFIKNTAGLMIRESRYFTGNHPMPELKTPICGRDVLIICRGRGYIDDLKSVSNIIKNIAPVVMGVDGGADAAFDAGIKCDIIIGDMDSVSDKSLLNCSEILVHSYTNGYAPGALRIKNLGLTYKQVLLKGTSEDAALYTAKMKGASKIYIIGSHTCIDEFSEKGRSGMSSTAIIRVLYGSNIIDLKGISSLLKYDDAYVKSSALFLILIFLIIVSWLFKGSIIDELKVFLNFD